VSNVIPFPGPKKQQSCCPQCGWKMPPEIRADRDSVKQALNGERLMLYIDCPECGASLFWMVKFELGSQ
jgi:predicted RNA-binding Zn-ribbon protein involved in translation (DUF1610 family)